MSLPKQPKLHLNEHLSPSLAMQLRAHSVDVTSTQETNLRTTPDAVQLAYAAAQKRAIVTFNFADFTQLHTHYMQEGQVHWGIILSTAQPIGILLRRLLRLVNTLSADDLRNQIRWLNDFK